MTRENAHGNVIFVIDNKHTSVYGAKLISGTKYFTLSNHYHYPCGVQFRVDRVQKESIGSTIYLYVRLEDYSRVQQVPPLETDQEFVAARKSLLILFKPTNKPTYRGMELTEHQLKDYPAGHHFTWLSFSSSYLCKERAKRFGKHIFVINNTCTLQRKYSPKSIMNHSMFDEREYLYPSGAKFIIDYIQNKNGYIFFYVHLEDY